MNEGNSLQGLAQAHFIRENTALCFGIGEAHDTFVHELITMVRGPAMFQLAHLNTLLLMRSENTGQEGIDNNVNKSDAATMVGCESDPRDYK